MKKSPEGSFAGTEPLSLDQRRRLILALIAEEGHVTTEKLAERFSTSPVTIRSDLNALANSGAVVRTHGGALPLADSDEVPIEVKESLHQTEKSRIAAAAAALICDGETVLLDSGTTTGEVAKHICRLPLQGINVITNALNIAVTLAHTPHVRLVMLGGLLRRHSFSLSGPQAELALAGLRADRLFLGVDSLDPEIGLMTPHLLEAQLNAQMILVAREVIAVADSSKLLKRNLAVIAKVEQIDRLITDTGADPQIVAALQARGVTVTLV